MRQTQQLTGKNGLQQIARNVTKMRREKSYLEVRQVAITRTLRRIERQLAISDDAEEEQNLHDIIDNLCAIGSDLETYRAQLEVELDKVNRGVQTLETLRGKPGKVAFAAYIMEDTELSLRDLAQVHSYYDQVIETIKKLKDDQLA